ncbi:MAG TPA: hypothetical protein VEY88_23810 [Archangium sp.]|nr:hypothetical protein [Archangium sp.]
MNAKPALFTAALLTAPGFALADSTESKTCTPENVAGSYGLSAFGTHLPGNAAGLPPGPVTAAGVLVLEANGQLHGHETISFNGTVSSGVQYDGTYTVNPDCTITLEDPRFFHNFGVFVANRSELMLMSTDSGVLLTLTAKRIHTK